MALFSSNGPSSLGALNIPAFWPTPPLPTLIADWAALLPLICHLASRQHEHQFLGKVALSGRVRTGLFPKLGVLAGVSRLLKHGADFLDDASTKGNSSRTVWDVNWGSVFPCANGAASTIISRFALRNVDTVVKMPEEFDEAARKRVTGGVLLPNAVNSDTSASSPSPVQRQDNAPGCEKGGAILDELELASNRTLREQGPLSKHRRYQTLHILRFTRTPSSTLTGQETKNLPSHPVLQAALVVILFKFAVILGLFGLYGSAAIVVLGSISQLLARHLVPERPASLLLNNETHDACMLTGIHSNASTWYLYIGDRGVVDHLLNKTMVAMPVNQWRSRWFMLAHTLQLIAMTYVAAQRGWDGVSLLILMILSWFWETRHSDHRLAKLWLERHNVSIDAHSFEFSGRVAMIGAIQKLSGGKVTRWMETISSPSLRQDAWLKQLDSYKEGRWEEIPELRALSPFDQEWVARNLYLTMEAVQTIKRIMLKETE